MSPTLERLRDEILALPSPERESLIAAVSDDPENANLDLHPAWRDELRYRSSEYRAGRMGGVSLDEFEEELNEVINRS